MANLNLDQIRAANALEAGAKKFSGKNDGDIIKKVPTMIRDNGLLGALAFAIENPGSGYWYAFEAIISHLSDKRVNKCVAGNMAAFLREMVSSDSAKLRDATVESMAYLNYLRRFAFKGDKK